MNADFLEKAKGVKSLEDLLALAKKEGIDLGDQAKKLFESLKASDKLPTDALNKIAGLTDKLKK